MPLKMTLDDKEFTLSNDALKDMASTLWRTKAKERGRMLCGRKPSKLKVTDEVQYVGEIDAGAEYIGGRGSIVERNCGPNLRVGHFHTHPVSTADPSWWDAYAILSNSYRHKSPWLGCRGSNAPPGYEEIQCTTARTIPSLSELQYLKRKRRRMAGVWASSDPEIAKYLTESCSIPARKIPEIIKPPVPVPVAPRIKSEEVVFAGSAFMRYTNLDTGEERIQRVY